jgi:small multidrug resistance pump
MRSRRTLGALAMNPWILLAASIASEVLGTTALKLADGFTRSGYTAAVFVCYGLSFYMFSIAVRHLELGIAYAIWAGMGTVLIAVIGIVWFRESTELLKIISMLAIVGGVIGLNLASARVAG